MLPEAFFPYSAVSEGGYEWVWRLHNGWPGLDYEPIYE